MLIHPYAVEPYGNFLIKGGENLRISGMGALGILKDEQLLEICLFLEAEELLMMSLVSKAMYVLARHEDLWRSLTLQEVEVPLRWRGSWRHTYFSTHKGRDLACPAGPPAVSTPGFYSDLLYQPWFCAKVELQPHWLEVDNIDRRSGLTVEEFRTQYEVPNRPVVVTDVVRQWPACTKWTSDYLQEVFGDQEVLVGNYPMTLSSYFRYCSEQQDEMPLYLFDKHFCTKAPLLVGDFEVPSYFEEDLFSVLGKKRPDFRWLIMGPPRSGSSFHIDPNATSAWNAVVKGTKKWILYPPGCIPPGVHPAPGGADVATPLSLVDWFLNFYDATKEGKVRPVECLVHAGEVLFVPSGWWHLAINLEESIAVTQNYVSSVTLPRVLEFLKSGNEQLVSGCAMSERSNLYQRFLDGLEQQRPAVLKKLRKAEREKKRRREQDHRLAIMFKVNKSTQNSPAAENENDRSLFKFQFL